MATDDTQPPLKPSTDQDRDGPAEARARSARPGRGAGEGGASSIAAADLATLLDRTRDGLMLLCSPEDGWPVPEILGVNRTLLELVGLPRSALERRSVRVIRGATAPLEQFARLIQMVTAAERGVLDLPLRRAAATDLPTRLHLEPLGQPGTLVAVWVEPIAVDRSAEEVLSAAVALIGKIGELTDAIYYVGRVSDLNGLELAWIDPRIGTLLGRPPEQLVRRQDLATWLLDADRPAFRQHVRRLISGDSSAVRFRVQTRAGPPLRLADRAQPIAHAADGRVMAVAGALTPVPVAAETGAGRANLERLAERLARELGAPAALVRPSGELVWASLLPDTRLGRTVRESFGRDWHSIAAERELDRWIDLVETAFTRREAVSGTAVWPIGRAEPAAIATLAPLDETLALALFREAQPAVAARPSSIEAVSTPALSLLLSALADASSDGVLVLASSGEVTIASDVGARLLGRVAAELPGMGVGNLLTVEGTAAPALLRLLREDAIEKMPRREAHAILPGGQHVPVEVQARVVGAGERLDLVLTVRDAGIRHASEDAIRYLASYDTLTGLPNRRLFEERLERTIDAARDGGPGFTVLLLDLARFTLINDSLGLSMGDLVLSAVAERLLAATGEGRTVARFGADDFMIVAPDIATPEAAARFAQRLLETLRAPLNVGEHEIVVESNIGIALYPVDGREPDTLVKNAFAALARAAELGGNRYQFYTDDMNSSAFARLMLETRLRRALDQRELQLHFQPQLTAGDGALVGLEALLRWTQPELGAVAPAEFIPLAEDTGLIVPIGAWVLEHACRQGLQWQRELGRPDLRIAVNLSARQFEHKDLVPAVARALELTGFPARCLELELTESVVMRDADEAVRRLLELTAIGVGLAIDDFGTGYSSLAYLRRFPIRSLKIDRSFTADLEHDPGCATIARAVVALGASLGLRVLAEGVETQGQLDMLVGFGCDEVQGYHLCRPLPPAELSGFLHAAIRQPPSPAG